ALAQSTSSQSTSQNLVARCDLPVVDLFNPSPGDMVLPGAYMISGLALDPMSQQASGIDDVSFFLGDRDHGGQLLGSVIPSGGPRMDDFTVSVTVPSAEPGSAQQLQVFAHSALSGKETELSIPITIGSNPSRSGPSASAPARLNTNPGALPASCLMAAPS